MRHWIYNWVVKNTSFLFSSNSRKRSSTINYTILYLKGIITRQKGLIMIKKMIVDFLVLFLCLPHNHMIKKAVFKDALQKRAFCTFPMHSPGLSHVHIIYTLLLLPRLPLLGDSVSPTCSDYFSDLIYSVVFTFSSCRNRSSSSISNRGEQTDAESSLPIYP